MDIAEKAAWYGNRLAAMSAPEILFRMTETARRRLDKIAARHVRVAAASVNPVCPPAIPGLRDGLLAWSVPDSLLDDWREVWRQAARGEFILLGQAWPACEADRRWHLDPVSGTFWPNTAYCFDIDYRHAHGKGDVKYVWELNRLQYLQPIAALACRENNPEAGRFCAAEIESWIEQNPPHVGVNWASGIELALRAVSLLVVTSLAGEWMTGAQLGKIMATLERHALWIARYPSRYSSANNHRTAEGLGLLLIGALCPGFSQAHGWKIAGWASLCDDARQQILPDGVGAEQTITYTAVVLEMLLLGRHIADVVGLPVPEDYTARLVRGGEYLRWFTDAGGHQPRIGDDDNACVLGVYREQEPYVRSVLGCIAAMASRADLTPPGLAPHFRQALFGRAPPAAPGPSGLKHFPQGGYSVGRTQAREHHILLAMDHGYLGYLSIAAHGHADALAVWLHVGDQPVFVDAGTYLYHAGGSWRNWFRGTAAHNTLCLGGANASTMSGNFNWSHKAAARLVDSGTGDGGWWVEAEHDGYRRRFGALHRRRLTVTGADGFTIQDWLITDTAHPVEVNFLLHPDLTVSAADGVCRICKDSVAILQARADGPLQPHAYHAGDPEAGWYSPGFGKKLAAPRLVFAGMLAPGQTAAAHFNFL